MEPTQTTHAHTEILSDALHKLAQPLTALSFLLDIALTQNPPDVCRDSIEQARREIQRAFVLYMDVCRAGLPQPGEETPWEQR